MPKNRSRSVKNSFDFPKNFLESLPNIEPIKSNTRTVSSRKSASKLNNNSAYSCDPDSDLDIVSFDKSSSSSNSWSDDFDHEATQRVRHEFERMERVLQGREPIPSHYNNDEYKQWITTFPQLSVIGHGIAHSPITPNTANESNSEEVIACHSDNDYFTPNGNISSADLKRIHDIRNIAVEEIFKNVSKKLLNDSGAKRKGTTKIPKPLELSTPKSNQFSRIIPKEVAKSPTLDKGHSLIPKWAQSSFNAHTSLPYINSAKNSNYKQSVRKKSSSVSRYSSNTSLYKNKFISLPPIKTSNVSTLKQFRSISTTPRDSGENFVSSSIPVRTKTKRNVSLSSKKSELRTKLS